MGSPLAWLTAAAYITFTLLPDSNSLMVQWPWVAVWQISLLCPILWLLLHIWQEKKLFRLGNKLDWVMGAIALGLVISTVGAEFRPQALWYSWAAFGFLAAVYALNNWLRMSYTDGETGRWDGLLIAQGYLNLAFILVSLSLWTTQTFLPELARLKNLKQYGVEQSFNFSVLELRNWAPIGHQNYVAGYLILALPLLLGLSLWQKGWRRWLWVTGVGLGLVDLYTTSSRGGWLGLMALCLVGLVIVLSRRHLRGGWLGRSTILGITVVVLLALGNPRLRSLLFRGGGELAYRIINLNVGWSMGIAHPWSGIGLGGVPLLYQKYRPIWAGRESELAYQLHSTPAQLWAEMGLWGILPVGGVIAFLVYLFWGWLRQSRAGANSILIWSLYGGLFAYGIISLTDYQLDNISISGTLVIYLACIASTVRSQESGVRSQESGVRSQELGVRSQESGVRSQESGVRSQESGVRSQESDKLSQFTSQNHPSLWFSLAGLGMVLAMVIWLIPVHRAWYLSSQGFRYLSQNQVEEFGEKLTIAQQLVPWEPYYPYQLGWNLGNLSLETRDAQQQQLLRQAAISEFERGITVSPYQEFGYNNLAWLLLKNNPAAAGENFTRAAQLVPAKRGVRYGLGLSLLAQGKTNLAIKAFVTEGLRDPLSITSPFWRSPQLRPLLSQITDSMANQYTQWLQQYSQPGDFNTYLHRCRGGLYWWQGNFTAARQDLEVYGTPLSQLMLDFAEGKLVEPKLSQLPESAAKFALMMWLEPKGRLENLQKAWLMATQEQLNPSLEQNLLGSMANSASFYQWLTQKSSSWQYRRQRPGFGIVSRHLDGPAPTDFFPVVENVAMVNWFSELLPSPDYFPELDLLNYKL